MKELYTIFYIEFRLKFYEKKQAFISTAKNIYVKETEINVNTLLGLTLKKLANVTVGAISINTLNLHSQTKLVIP